MASKRLSEYERRRLENIKRNGEMMEALKLHSKALSLSFSSSSIKRPRTQFKKIHKPPSKEKPKPKTPIVLRRSLRARGIPPDTKAVKGLEEDMVSSLVNHPTFPKFTPANSRHFTMQEAYVGTSSSSSQALVDTIVEMSYNAPLRGGWMKKDVEVIGGFLNFRWMELKEETVARIMPDKIMNAKFFPCDDRRLVVAGNKLGDVAFWDVDREKGEDDNRAIYLYHPHSSPISGILIQPFSLSKVITSCYDGFIRLMDVEKESFDLVYSSNQSVFSLSQRSHDPWSLYFGEGRGLLNVWDVRVGKSSSSWMLHTLRINTVDFNPENTNLVVTSSTDRTARLWDLRRIDATGSNYLKTVEHDRPVHSAYFLPSGNCLATTSSDDKVGISSGVDFMDTSMIYHYNQTGRWVSTFRATWGWDDTHLFIGNMRRGVDVISTTDQKTVTLESSLMTSITCRFAPHPYMAGTLVAVTSGGEVYVWMSS